MVRLPNVLRNYPNNSKGSTFYKSLYHFIISLVTQCKNIIIIKLTLLPIYLSDLEIFVISKTFKNLGLDFIWSLRKPKIKKNVIVQNIENGGIKVPNIATMVKANRISWIQQLPNGSNAKWKCILTSLIKPFSLKHFTKIPLDDEAIKTLQIPFYEQIYNVWNNSRQNPNSKWQYLEQIIWKNKHIQLHIVPKKKQYKLLM